MVEHKGVASIQEIAGEKTVSITHIPANDWAAIGARITTDAKNVSVNRRESGWSCVIICNDGELRSGNGETPLEALTAALDAAEGKQQ